MELTVMDMETKQLELVKEGLSHKDEALSLVRKINDPDGPTNASGYLQSIKSFMKAVKEHFESDIEKAFSLHKSLTAKRSAALAPLLEADEILRVGIKNYAVEQERKMRVEQERLMAEQKKAAEEAQLAAAEEADKSGDHEMATAILEQPVTLTVPQMQKPKIAGISTPERWEAEAYGKLDFIKAIAAGIAPIELVTVDTVALRKIVGILKKTNPYPGVRAWKTFGVSVRSK